MNRIICIQLHLLVNNSVMNCKETRVKGMITIGRKILKWIGNIIFLFLIVIAVLSLYSGIQARRHPGVIPSILGYKPMSVLSGSMRPLLQPGDMIVVKDVDYENVNTGDVITFKVNETTLVTHRVVDILEENGTKTFRTKGDANNTEDSGLITPEHFVGVLAFSIPKGGYVGNFIRSPIGFMLLILLPIFFLIGGEIKNMLSAMNQDKREDSNHQDNVET